jgi:hypothetical protein
MSFLEQIKQKQNLRETPTRESDKKRKPNPERKKTLVEQMKDAMEKRRQFLRGGADPMFRKYLKYKLKYLDLLNNEE